MANNKVQQEKITTKKEDSLDYLSSGVNIAAGNSLVESIKKISRETHNCNVIGGVGGFAALFNPNIKDYKEPILVSCTDGVGTKLKLAQLQNHHIDIGIDLVAMCANDLIVTGAKPLFFLDYFATGKLDVAIAKEVIKGIAEGCKQANMALIGGETAEMPGFYNNEEYDLAGFAVGIVDKHAILGPHKVKKGDALIALASSGPHANGYSLIRKIIDNKKISLKTAFAENTLGEQLIIPTKIYVKEINELQKNITINAAAHITGGGILENIPRVIPKNLQAVIHQDSWTWPSIFNWLKAEGNINTHEMLKTFNCGVGFIVILDKEFAEKACTILHNLNISAWQIGEVRNREKAENGITIY